jgi:beta-mannosidase
MERRKAEFWRNAKVKIFRFNKKLSDAQAEVSFNMSIFAEEEGEYYTWFNLNRGMHKFHLNKGFNTIILPYKIKEPKKWQPNGRGTPALYTTKISCIKKGGGLFGIST